MCIYLYVDIVGYLSSQVKKLVFWFPLVSAVFFVELGVDTKGGRS